MSLTNDLISTITYDSVTISVPQGTTADFDIDIEDESTGKKYVPTSSTKVVFGVKRNKDDNTLLISKELTYNSGFDNYHLKILPEDTTDLPRGRYYFDISLSESEEFFKQIVPVSIFMITASIAVNPA